MTLPPTAAPLAASVHWDAAIGAFVITGFDEASAVLRGPGWSSDPANSPLTPQAAADVPTALMLFRDPPDHTRLRRLVAPAFSARAVESLRPRVAAVAESCLDEIALDGTVDLLADVGYLVPLAVIAELMDVGVEGAEVFLEQTPRLVKLLELDASLDDLAEATAAALEVTMFLTPVLAQRRGGGDDFISALLATELSLDEVLATCVLLLAAGHETTANLIANGALALLPAGPAQREALFTDPARAVEELLRLHGPVKIIGRTALEDHDVGGVRIARGRQVLVLVDQANRDPRRWSEPTLMDLNRSGPGHLGFGTGIHFCLGAALARLEAAETLTRLFDRHPQMRLAGPVSWRASSTFHALQSLPISLR